MRDQINAAMKAAMKSQEKRRTSTLRLVNAAIKDRDIANRGNGKDAVDDAGILEILSKMVKQRRESIKTYEDAGRLELAEQEQEEISIIEEFLPKQMSEDETRSAVVDVMKALDCQGLKDMGRTMGELKSRYAGQMDFGRASAIVKEQLG